MRGYVLIGVSAAGFGLMPIFAVYAYDNGLNVPTLLFLRFALAALLLFAYTWGAATARRRRERRAAGAPRGGETSAHGGANGGAGARAEPGDRGRGGHAGHAGHAGYAGLIRLPAGDLARLFLMGGVLYTAQSSLYFSSVQHISPALAALLLYLYPGLVAAASAVVTRERPSPVLVLAVLVSFAGVALALGRISGDLSIVGITQAVGAALVYTVYILYGDRAGARMPPVTMSAYIALFAAMSSLFLGVATGRLDMGFDTQGWLPVLGVTVVSTVLAILSFFLGMALIGPTKASIGSMLEPVVSIGAAAVLLGADLTPLQLVGGCLVLVGATTGVLSRRPRDAASDHSGPLDTGGPAGAGSGHAGHASLTRGAASAQGGTSRDAASPGGAR